MVADAGIKQAALVLHGLAPSDCEWMLSQLPADQQAPLRDTLAELRELGIPRDAQLTRVAVEAARQAAARSADHQALANADATQLATALRSEPESVVHAALGVHDWPWAESLRAQLRTGPAPGHTPSRGDAFNASLMSALAQRLPGSAAPATTPPGKRGRPWLDSLRKRRVA